MMSKVAIPTPDGEARAFTFTPEGDGPWPAVIFYMDAPAIRPALFQMCERLASHGYYVLLPDMFWRAGPYDPIDLKTAFASDEARRTIFGKFMASTSPEKSTRDTGAFLAWLEKQPKAKTDKLGCTGYCMGAALALRAAGNYPGKIAAAAGFHGGRLATDEADSPHLLAPKIKAKVYIAGADEDAGFPPEQADRLRAALTQAGVDNRVEIYAGARHGYAPPDMPVYNEAAAERHWRELLALLDETLKGQAA
ncbi:MAG TPA: dienelactone hydrolase family protein [Caulobacteraceae bacterium]|jgi:carboxymethylenebutenolidase|nr:dienelactone hydrolase family protein [Caulobacteraceae bacterium]